MVLIAEAVEADLKQLPESAQKSALAAAALSLAREMDENNAALTKAMREKVSEDGLTYLRPVVDRTGKVAGVEMLANPLLKELRTAEKELTASSRMLIDLLDALQGSVPAQQETDGVDEINAARAARIARGAATAN